MAVYENGLNEVLNTVRRMASVEIVKVLNSNCRGVALSHSKAETILNVEVQAEQLRPQTPLRLPVPGSSQEAARGGGDRGAVWL